MSAEPGLMDTGAYGWCWEFARDHMARRRRGEAAHLADLARAGELARAAEDMCLRLVADLRSQGETWENIGTALGISKQAASQLHKRAIRSR